MGFLITSAHEREAMQAATLSVRLSVCLSLFGVVPEWLNIR